jgi:DNA-binding MarR family transcriptional regulator
MTKRLDRLERAGLVKRSPNPDDRRGVKVALTARGRKLVDRAIEAQLDNERALIAHLSTPERQRLAALLRRLLEGFA